MNRYSYIIILLLCLPWMVFAQEKSKSAPAGGKNKAPMTYEAFFKKDMKRVEGVFPIYRSDKKCYMEIPARLLGKDLMASGIITKGPWNGQASAITDLLVFTLGENHQLDVKKQICTDRAEGDMANAVEASSLKPILYSYPIAAYGKDKQGYIIDITADVNATGKLFAFPNLQWVNRPEASRSGLDSVYVIRNGVKFVSLHTQTDYMPGGMGSAMGYDKHSSVLIEWTLQQLPDRNIIDREADTRVGYSVLSFNDYDRNPYQVEQIYLVRRWNLQIRPEDVERYKRGELVEPADPIYVYFDNSFSPASREAAARGVEEWNKCFEQAGFKNVLQVQEGEPEAVFAYHQLVYSHALVLKKINTITDPRTGEILCGNVSIGGSDIDKALKTARWSLGAYEPAIYTDSLATAWAESVRSLTSSVTGQVLGLVPNVGGSMAFTTKQLRDAAWLRENGISSSVTDGCVVNYAVLPGDNIPLKDLFSKVSFYDRWAIEWGYRQFPGMSKKEEQAALREIAKQAKNNPYLFYTPEGRRGYRSNKFDLAQDKLAAAVIGMENLKNLLPRLEGIVDKLDKEDAWYTYWEYMKDIYMAYNAYVALALDYIGTVSPEPIIAGYNEESFMFVPKAQQEEAMRFLEKYAFSGIPAWMKDPTAIKIAGYDGEEIMVSLLKRIFGRLNSSDVLIVSMLSQQKLGDSAYKLSDMYNAIDRSVFLNYSTSKRVDRYTARMQYCFVKSFMDLYMKANTAQNPDELSFYLINRMSQLIKSFEQLGRTHADANSRQHYHGLSVYLKRGLMPKKEAGIPVKK